MTNPTSSFGWQMPTNTDLVTDLPADFEVFGQAVDTSMADLLGGTTGQILAKNSATNMDFVWITNDVGDITAVTAGTGISGGGTSGAVTITNSMATEITAKGDLIVGTGSATFDNLAAGANGSTLVADSAASTGLSYVALFGANKNKIINGDFLVNQRSFTSTTTASSYGFDRWLSNMVDGTTTYSAQTFTPGAAPVAGYEGTNFARLVTTGQTLSTAQSTLSQKIEDVRTFANQTISISFWAKANTGTPKIATELVQNFGSGGSASVTNYAGQSTLSTSWARYSVSVALPSISGKTVGTSSFLGLNLWVSAGTDFNARTGSLGIQTNTFDIWGVQVEAGSVATAFQTATGNLASELAACQRYYYRALAGSLYGAFGTGLALTTTDVTFYVQNPVTMRTVPTSVDSSTLQAHLPGISALTISGLVISYAAVNGVNVSGTVSGATAFRPYLLAGNNNVGAYVGFSAEL